MQLAVKRCHGLGDLLMLLPVLIKAAELGYDVTLVTRAEWVEEAARWCPRIRCTPDPTGVTHDLDQLTKRTLPTKHRTAEFATALCIPGPFPLLASTRPSYEGSLANQFRGSIIFAPEAGHAARRWPDTYAKELSRRLLGSPLVLMGVEDRVKYPANEDLRGRLSLRQMFEVISEAKCVISMDSGILHAAMALEVRVVAIFGGVDPAYRILRSQRALVLTGSAECWPCNKNETCNGAYFCIHGIQVDDVVDAARDAPSIGHLEIRTADSRLHLDASAH